MLILASEDIGLANPNALLLAQACFNAVKVIGWPESRLILSETAIYLAISPKSTVYMAMKMHLQRLNQGDLPVPPSEKCSYKPHENIGYGKL